MIAYPFAKPHPITDDFAAHLARISPSTAPGVDFAASQGTAVHSPAEGKVLSTPTTKAGGLGLWIGVTQHDPPISVYYCHLSARAVVRYQCVSPGQVIANTGNTGHSTGPHLHLAVKIGKQYVDPLLYLAQPPIPRQDHPEPVEGQEAEEPIMPTVWEHTVSPLGHVQLEANGDEITLTAHEPTSPTPSYLQAIREPAFNHQAVPRNPDAALLKYARRHGLGAPLTPEYHVTHLSVDYTCQGYAQAILICPTGDWDNISEIAW